MRRARVFCQPVYHSDPKYISTDDSPDDSVTQQSIARFDGDYRGYFIVSFEFRRPESRHWSYPSIFKEQSLLRGINRCVSHSVTGNSRDIVHYSYCIGTVVSHLASRRGLCLSIGIDQLRFRRTVRCCQLVKLRVIYSMAFGHLVKSLFV